MCIRLGCLMGFKPFCCYLVYLLFVIWAFFLNELDLLGSQLSVFKIWDHKAREFKKIISEIFFEGVQIFF